MTTHIVVDNDIICDNFCFKPVLNNHDFEIILDYFNGAHTNTNDISTLVSGIRIKKELETPALVISKISTQLTNFIVNPNISPYARMYFQTCGAVKPHRDKSLYGDFEYTCLIYLSDDFIGGNLSLIVENADTNVNIIYTIIPKKGYAVIFHKSICHYADEIVDGTKKILLVDVAKNSKSTFKN